MAERELRVRLEAQTTEFSARMAAAAAQLQRLETPTSAARKSVRLLENSLQSLAAQAVGLPGPLGAVARSLGLLTIGGTAMLGVMAGIGGAVLLFRHLTRESREAKQRIDEFIKSLERTRQTELVPREVIQRSETELVRLQQRLEALQRARLSPIEIETAKVTGAVVVAGGPASREEAKLQAEIAKWLRIREAALVPILEKQFRLVDLQREELESLRRVSTLRAELAERAAIPRAMPRSLAELAVQADTERRRALSELRAEIAGLQAEQSRIVKQLEAATQSEQLREVLTKRLVSLREREASALERILKLQDEGIRKTIEQAEFQRRQAEFLEELGPRFRLPESPFDELMRELQQRGRTQVQQDVEFFRRAMESRVGTGVDVRSLAAQVSTPPPIPGVISPEVQDALQREIEAERLRIATLQQLQAVVASGTASLEERAAAERLLAAVSRDTARVQMLAAQAISGIGVMIQGLIAGRQGGAGGLLGGALGLVGGIVGAANPIVGAVLSATGGIIATLAARREPIPVHDRQVRSELRELRQEIREVLVSVTFTGPERDLRSLRYELDRQTRRDAIPRLP